MLVGNYFTENRADNVWQPFIKALVLREKPNQIKPKQNCLARSVSECHQHNVGLFTVSSGSQGVGSRFPCILHTEHDTSSEKDMVGEGDIRTCKGNKQTTFSRNLRRKGEVWVKVSYFKT